MTKIERKIEFRGKSVDDGYWHYGYFVKSFKMGKNNRLFPYCIITNGENYWEVDCETVGQFTGYKDKNSNEIYEGDIVSIQVFKDFKKYGVVEFVDGCFVVTWEVKFNGLNENGEYLVDDDEEVISWEKIVKTIGQDELSEVHDKVTVIGNIYDNSELLKE